MGNYCHVTAGDLFTQHKLRIDYYSKHGGAQCMIVGYKITDANNQAYNFKLVNNHCDNFDFEKESNETYYLYKLSEDKCFAIWVAKGKPVPYQIDYLNSQFHGRVQARSYFRLDWKFTWNGNNLQQASIFPWGANK